MIVEFEPGVAVAINEWDYIIVLFFRLENFVVLHVDIAQIMAGICTTHVVDYANKSILELTIIFFLLC